MNLLHSQGAFMAETRRLPGTVEFDGIADEPVQFACFQSLNDVACLWLAFQNEAQTTVYHSHQWAKAWQSTVGARLGAEPQIIAGFGRQGRPLFILPLQSRRRSGLTVLEWHGSPDIPYGYGLFADAFLPQASSWFADNFEAVMAKAKSCDLIHLVNMPERMFGHPHPLVRSFNVTGANQSYLLRLDGCFNEVYSRKRNSETRRANRRKDNRMAELGKLEFRQVTDRRELPAVINLMLKHKIARLAAEGVHGVFEQEECAMMQLLAELPDDGSPLFTTHVLELDGVILACTFGGWLNGTYWFYVSSIGPEGPATKLSPGDLALRRTIEQCCAAGLDRFDFGAGSASYKAGWTDETVRLFSIVRANALKAMPLAAIVTAGLVAKGQVKQRPMLKDLVFRLRRVLAARHMADH